MRSAPYEGKPSARNDKTRSSSGFCHLAGYSGSLDHLIPIVSDQEKY